MCVCLVLFDLDMFCIMDCFVLVCLCFRFCVDCYFKEIDMLFLVDIFESEFSKLCGLL